MEDFPCKHSTQATSTVSETERFLSKLGHGYKKAKAQQILRLLKDQESLNKRFKDCALNEDDDDVDDTAPVGGEALGIDPQNFNNGNKPHKDGEGDQSSGVKKVSLNIDPSRCRTSMGFYNQAECSEPVDENKEEIIEFEAETDAALMEEREALLGPLVGHSRFPAHGGRRLFRLQLEDNEAILEENVVQSARSSRPKTGIAPSSVKSKQYRRPTQTDGKCRSSTKNPTISTSVSKLEGSMTPRRGVRAFCDNPSMPRDEYGCLVSTPRNSSFNPLTPRYNELNGILTPRVEDSAHCPTPRTNDSTFYTRLQHDLALCLTPRNNELPNPLTPRHSDWNFSQTPRQNELSLVSPRPKNPHRNMNNFYNQHTPREDIPQSLSSPRLDESSANMTPRTHTRKYGALRSMKGNAVPHGLTTVTLVEKANESSTKTTKKHDQSKKHNNNNSLADRGLAIGVRMPTTPRTMLTVDQSPVHAMQGVAENGEVVTPRRQKTESKKSKNSISGLQRTGVHQNLNKMPERVHPISMMKLPPLEVTMNKPVIS